MINAEHQEACIASTSNIKATTTAQAENSQADVELRLSVVIPMYNETARIRDTVPTLLAYFATQTYPHEFVIVDDGSSDGTADLAQELFASAENVRVLRKRPNKGKGAAVRAGMLAAKGDAVLVCDADLATPLEELDKFWRWLDDCYPVVIGSRKMAGANITHHQPLWRESLGKVFTWLTNHLATKDISDVTCGFKCFKRDAAQALFSRARLNDWSFDAEVLFIAQSLGYRIKEVPVTWHDKPGTKVRLIKDATRSIQGLMKIKLNALKGKYK